MADLEATVRTGLLLFFGYIDSESDKRGADWPPIQLSS